MSDYPQEHGRLDVEVFADHKTCRRYIPHSRLTTVDRLRLEELLGRDGITPVFTSDGPFFVTVTDSEQWAQVHDRVRHAVRLVYNVWSKHFKVVEHQLPTCTVHILQSA